jgi:nitrate reductase NapE component
MARAFVATPIFLMLVVLGASAQSHVDELRSRLESRFEIVPIANGIVLTPRFRTSIKSVELSSSTIAIDGAPVTGQELHNRLGNDAALILELSYLDAAARQSLAAGKTPPAPPKPVAPADPTTPAIDPGSTVRMNPEVPRTPRARQREDIVRIGGSVSVDSDEYVRGDVVVIGGSATINGEVNGEIVVVGGSARFGPQADVRGDITVVGGGLSRDSGAVIRGAIHEVGFGDISWRGGEWGRDANWGWMNGIYPVARLTGTLVRITLLVLLTTLVLFIAKVPVEEIADRVAADPVKSWFVGFLAEMLFIPVLIMTAVVLAISIIGIPLLVLLPVAVVALLVVMLVGFTAVAYHIGRLLQDRVEGLRTRPYAATFAGILLIVSPVLLARLVGLTGDLGFVVWPIAAVGFLLEYSVWTAGLGAAALVRFNRPPQAPAMVTTTPVA